jgi:putative chitinase
MSQFELDRIALRKMWPKAPQDMIDGVAAASAKVFKKYELNTALRVAHFMAQISHESDGGTIKEENMNYKTAERIAAVWPKRFTVESARPYVHNPQGLANKVYNGRMGNRQGSNDGFNYRGRGLLQLTGREAYDRIGKLVGLDLVTNPQLVAVPANALAIAACEFRELKCLEPADQDDIRIVTLRVNGGYIGIDSRRNWLTRWKLAMPSFPGITPTTPEGEKEIENDQLPRNADGDTTDVKPLDKSKTIWGGILGWLTGAGATIGTVLQNINNKYALIAILAFGAVGTFAAYLIIKGRIDTNKLIKELSGGGSDD